eukprot:CAMPEP_0172598138 /NCGR_PEP_ID=MMETSP1068-20121228/18140_1 /TAXON_ID=35684 /ORGANISM="Pseudopedinella elastica, Strain CCMP716" /LENGTH=196 /DNA_ID=CAMNT_0013397887 /DNA_START=37 /DNA_END=627 /DNA_ORIENTATION=-
MNSVQRLFSVCFVILFYFTDSFVKPKALRATWKVDCSASSYDIKKLEESRFGLVVDLPFGDDNVILKSYGAGNFPPAFVHILLQEAVNATDTVFTTPGHLRGESFDNSSSTSVAPFTTEWRGLRAVLAFDDEIQARQIAGLVSQLEGWPLRAARFALPDILGWVRSDKAILAVIDSRGKSGAGQEVSPSKQSSSGS